MIPFISITQAGCQTLTVVLLGKGHDGEGYAGPFRETLHYFALDLVSGNLCVHFVNINQAGHLRVILQ